MSVGITGHTGPTVGVERAGLFTGTQLADPIPGAVGISSAVARIYTTTTTQVAGLLTGTPNQLTRVTASARATDSVLQTSVVGDTWIRLDAAAADTGQRTVALEIARARVDAGAAIADPIAQASVVILADLRLVTHTRLDIADRASAAIIIALTARHADLFIGTDPARVTVNIFQAKDTFSATPIIATDPRTETVKVFGAWVSAATPIAEALTETIGILHANVRLGT